MSKRPRAEQDALTDTRQAVASATNLTSTSTSMPIGPDRSSTQDSRGRTVRGPTLPTREDLILNREALEEDRFAERSHQRKRERAEVKESVEDIVGPKETGRDGMLEKKRMKREGDRAFRDAKDDGLDEVDDKTLMGGGDSFRARSGGPVRIKLSVHANIFAESRNETRQGSDSTRNGRLLERRKWRALGSEWKACARKIKLLWICSSSWLRKGSVDRMYDQLGLWRHFLADPVRRHPLNSKHLMCVWLPEMANCER